MLGCLPSKYKRNKMYNNTSMLMTNEIRPASTVALCKITIKWPFKILALKRSEKAAFLPGAHVFPGGRLDQADHDFGDFLALDHQNTQRICAFFSADQRKVAAHLAAAVRETLEETGLSILRISSHEKSTPCDPITVKRLIKDPNFRASCGVKPSLDNLWPISWWITPEGETRRYNTWFFLGLIDEESQVKDHDPEISEAVWIHPQEALQKYEAKEMFLAPPTRTILERMAQTHGLEDFLSYVDQPLLPIEPFFVEHNQQKLLVLPGDPLHHEQRRASMPLSTRYVFP
jgi:8-oxo-dGTP pyrophosphatase MutT (NUDIX family)